ncbi:MBG domain-containing protein, partial [Flavobacterium nitrogenifigens]
MVAVQRCLFFVTLHGSPSDAIALVEGDNVITTVVTAQDGSTTATYTITVTRTKPVIVNTGTLLILNSTYGTPSVSGTFNVSGTNMLEGILVAPPIEFEVSADNVTFTDNITIGAAGTISATPVYIRLKGNIGVGNYIGNIVLSSNSAITVNSPQLSGTVSKAALIVTADDKSKPYGSANPTLTVSYSGFVNGDTEASLDVTPSISTTATASSPVGLYAITASGASSPNYSISYVDGNLTVGHVALIV